MQSAQKHLSATKTPHEKKVIETQIAATDRQIDAAIRLPLYRPNTEEIKIVEQTGNESAARSQETEETPNEENGENKGYTPYQPGWTPEFLKNGITRNARRIELAERKSCGTLTPEEETEFEELQESVFNDFQEKFGSPALVDKTLERLEQKFNIGANLEGG